jgi:hypothetical protein
MRQCHPVEARRKIGFDQLRLAGDARAFDPSAVGCLAERDTALVCPGAEGDTCILQHRSIVIDETPALAAA